MCAGEVERGPLRAWLHFATTGRPHVTWKFAATLDGRSAAADGTSRWITSTEARELVHDLRAHADAVVVGTGTALRDDPKLTARDRSGAPLPRQPLPVVVGHRDLAADSQLSRAGAMHIRSQDPAAVLTRLRDRGVVDVLLEGGPRLAGAFLATGHVDRVIAHLAPALLGSGTPALTDAGIDTIADIARLQVDDVQLIGPDVVVDGRPELEIAA